MSKPRSQNGKDPLRWSWWWLEQERKLSCCWPKGQLICIILPPTNWVNIRRNSVCLHQVFRWLVLEVSCDSSIIEKGNSCDGIDVVCHRTQIAGLMWAEQSNNFEDFNLAVKCTHHCLREVVPTRLNSRYAILVTLLGNNRVSSRDVPRYSSEVWEVDYIVAVLHEYE